MRHDFHESLKDAARSIDAALDAAAGDTVEHDGKCSCAVCGIGDKLRACLDDLAWESRRRWNATNRVREFEWLEMD